MSQKQCKAIYMLRHFYYVKTSCTTHFELETFSILLCFDFPHIATCELFMFTDITFCI